jgi:hypothetical protein
LKFSDSQPLFITHVCIGKLTNCKYKIAGINWPDKQIKSLGIYFGNNNEESQKLIWENKIEKMNKLLCAWGKRKLYILGKILIIKSLILPLFTFLASVCLVRDIYHKEIQKKYFQFIWNCKPEYIKLSFSPCTQ